MKKSTLFLLAIATPATPPAIDSNYVDTVYKTETRAGITDTTEYYSFQYDAQKRLVTIKRQWGPFGQPYNEYQDQTWYYNGADTIPYKYYGVGTEGVMMTNVIYDTITVFFYYNGSSQLIKDSAAKRRRYGSTNIAKHYVSTYTHSANRVITFIKDSLLNATAPPPVAYHDIDTTNFVGQNPVSNITYSDANVNYPQFKKTGEGIAAYDAKPNPLAKLSNFRAMSPILGWGLNVLLNNSKNNLLSYTYTGTSSSSTLTYSYTYLPNNYISIAVFTKSGVPGSVFSYIYKYKAP